MILNTISKLVLPLLLVFAIYLLMRGHNAPGGGFIAGVMAGTAIAFQYIAFGSSAMLYHFKSSRLHGDFASGNGLADSIGFSADIDHPGTPIIIHVG